MAGYILSSGVLRKVAREAAEKAEDQSSASLVALVFSVFWLESYLNELIHHAFTIGQHDGGSQMERVRNLVTATDLRGRDSSLSVKAQVLATALSGQPMDIGAQPFQDFALLISLRNALVHQRPEQVSFALPPDDADPTFPEKHLSKLVRALAARNLVPRPIPRGEVLSNSIARARVAVWAFNVATRVARHLFGLMDEGFTKTVALMSVDEFSEISPAAA
jgi:hypothetical protein